MKKPTPQLCGFNWLGAVFSGVVFLKILLNACYWQILLPVFWFGMCLKFMITERLCILSVYVFCQSAIVRYCLWKY